MEVAADCSHIIVPRPAVGVVIGKNGDMIKWIQQDSGARVQFIQGKEDIPGDKLCQITGTMDQVQKASSLIRDLIQSVMVPYYLSDIQLPESPDCHVKSKDSKSEERNQVDHVSDELSNENTHSDSKNKSHGEAIHKSNSSQEDDVSESETKKSSRSGDSSSERQHSKKAAKNKDFAQDNESNQLSDKSSGEMSIKSKKNDSATESPMDTALIKKRLKIKRDNVPIELPSPKKELFSPTKETSTSNKNIERNSSSPSVPGKPLKQESIAASNGLVAEIIDLVSDNSTTCCKTRSAIKEKQKNFPKVPFLLRKKIFDSSYVSTNMFTINKVTVVCL